MQQPSLIGLTGHKGAGKDEVARILGQFGYVRIALADPLKQIASVIGWNGSKEDVPPCPHCGSLRGRQLLQVLGTEGVRQVIDDAAWLKVAHRRSLEHQLVVVPDIRFVNEAQWIWDNDGEIWSIERPGHDGDQHSSETEQEAITADVTILNDQTLEDLGWFVREALMGAGAAVYGTR